MKKKTFDFIVLVEGQMDVLACWQAGMRNVVAVSGTALTLEQLKILYRETNEIRIAFDNDEAGKKATLRAITLIQQFNLSLNKS